MTRNCKEFFDHIGETDMILREFIDVKERALLVEMDSQERRQFIADNIIPMAKKYGFEFTVDELDEFIREQENPFDVPAEGRHQAKERHTFRDAFHALFGKE